MLHGLYNLESNIKIPEKKLLYLERSGRNKSEVEEDDAIKKILNPIVRKNLLYFLKTSLPKNFVYLWWETKKYSDDKSAKYIFGRKIPYTILLSMALPSMIFYMFRLLTKPLASIRIYCLENICLILVFSFTSLFHDPSNNRTVGIQDSKNKYCSNTNL